MSVVYAKSEYIPWYDVKKGPFLVVLSVELGNTTTKCIVLATNLETGKAYIVNKGIRLTYDIPSKGEIFGKTVWKQDLTREGVSKFISETIKETLEESKLGVKDVHFVVRSTGVVAGFEKPEEVDSVIKALANGCLLAGIKPRQMTAYLTKENMPYMLQKHTLIDRVYFDGAIASVLPPSGMLAGNEMEGELVTAGIKTAAKDTPIDYRNPCISIDLGTTLAGRICNDGLPYASTTGNFCGLAGAILDSLVKFKTRSALEFKGKASRIDYRRANKYLEDVFEFINIEEIKNGSKYGTIPVSPEMAKKSNVTLIGCDCGRNGNALMELNNIGAGVYKKNKSHLKALIDLSSKEMVSRIIELALSKNIIDSDYAIGITGRAGTTEKKPEFIDKRLREIGFKKIMFVEDGLARGAAMLARCLHSLGIIHKPTGGIQGGKCIIKLREAIQ